MPVSFPYNFVAGQRIIAAQMMSQLNALAAKFTTGSSGIADADISDSAGIKGTKLSNIAGNRIPTDRLEDDAVDATKLRDDPLTDANRAVTTAHIRDAAVSTAKIANLAVVAGKIRAKLHSQALSGTLAAASQTVQNSTTIIKTPSVLVLTPSPVLTVFPSTDNPAGILPLKVWLTHGSPGAPPTPFFDLSVDILADSAHAPFFLVRNHGIATIGLTGMTIRFLYVAIT